MSWITDNKGADRVMLMLDGLEVADEHSKPLVDVRVPVREQNTYSLLFRSFRQGRKDLTAATYTNASVDQPTTNPRAEITKCDRFSFSMGRSNPAKPEQRKKPM